MFVAAEDQVAADEQTSEEAPNSVVELMLNTHTLWTKSMSYIEL